MLGNACILDKFYLWLQPKLGFLAAAEHMDVYPFLLLNVYSLSRRNTGLIITCYLGANLQKVSQTIDISK
jgi:hypothetical protein